MLRRLSGAARPIRRSCRASPSSLCRAIRRPCSLKALLGAVLIGMLMGFFDVVSGFKTYEVRDIFGTYLFLAGFIGALAIRLIAVFLQRDSVFFLVPRSPC